MNFLPRLFIFLFVFVITTTATKAQDSNAIVQLKQTLKSLEQKPGYNNDTVYISNLINLGYLYSFGYPDSTLLILAGNAERCRKINYRKGETNTYLVMGDAFVSKGMYKEALKNFDTSYQIAKSNNYQNSFSSILNRIGTVYLNQGNYPEALNRFYESLKAAEAIGNNELISATLTNIANVQFYQNKFSEAENTYMRMLKVAEAMHDTSLMSHAHNNLGMVNLQQKHISKAVQQLIIAYNLASQVNDREMLLNSTLSIAEVYYTMDSLQKSAALYEKGLQLAKQTDHGSLLCTALIGLAKIHYKQGMLKEALANGLEALERAKKMGQVQLMRDANEIVSSAYEAMKNSGNALAYFKQYKLYSDSMNNMQSQRAVAIEREKYDFSKKEADFERKTMKQHWLTFSAFAGLLLLAVILWIILRNRNRLKHTYKILQHKNIVIESEKSKAEDTLSKLQSTQAQLIQSEKMASLGELTAGIAHEIQNPLNFVNNFSELNNELIDEMSIETDTEELKIIATDIKQNNEKIAFHGKRADAIVKSMLQHSRKNTGQKELTNISALCDEYLRLSYHGLRAKDKSFNADFRTDFDDNIGKIKLIQQDIGRVLLNLCNNALYAVNEKKKTSANGYQPLVTLSTRKLTDKIEIQVEDNGNGVPKEIMNKIFQPFFTTKPTGQGTGLGLSLAYDIITKEHGGSIQVESEENLYTRFTIRLPV